MNSDIVYEEIEIRGVWLPVFSTLTYAFVDDSFSHEFGTEKGFHWEVEEIEPICVDGNLREYVLDYLVYSGRATKRNSRFKKLVRQLERAIMDHLNALDPDNFWGRKLVEAANEYEGDNDR